MLLPMCLRITNYRACFYNVASQKLTVYCFNSTTNLPTTGDAANLTAYRDIDDGGVTVLADTSATEKDAANAKGLNVFDLAQSETNGDKILFTCKSSTANIVCLAMPAVVYTTPPIPRTALWPRLMLMVTAPLSPGISHKCGGGVIGGCGTGVDGIGARPGRLSQASTPTSKAILSSSDRWVVTRQPSGACLEILQSCATLKTKVS